MGVLWEERRGEGVPRSAGLAGTACGGWVLLPFKSGAGVPPRIGVPVLFCQMLSQEPSCVLVHGSSI